MKEYEPIINHIMSRTQLELELIDEDFNYWIKDLISFTETEQNWYIKWKTGVNSNLTNNFNQFKQFANTQIQQNKEWLTSNKEILTNSNKYPLKVNSVEKKTYNFTSAIARITKPIASSLSTLDLSKVEIADNNVGTQDQNQSKEDNIEIKSKILPKYNGSESFIQAAKAYYTCPYQKHTPNVMQMNSLLQTAYKFCNSYNSYVSMIQQDLTGINSFISKDPTTGQYNNSQQSDLDKLKAAQSKTIATTNPNTNLHGGANAVNASAEIEAFMNHYFNEEDVSSAPQVNTSNDVSQVQSASNTKTGSNTQAQGSTSANITDKNNLPNGQPKQADQTSINLKRKQIVTDIYIDAFNAKMSAVGELYRAMLLLLRTHVASYKGSDGIKNNEQQSTKK